MTMNKYGELTEDSFSDFDSEKKAEYYDADGYGVADEANKDKLHTPVRISELKKQKEKQD